MPEIAISHTTFERLQQYAEPFVDTPDTVVNRALDALEQSKSPIASIADPSGPERQIDPRNLPDLTHTKVLDASWDGKRVAKPNWNLLLDRALRSGMEKVAAFDELRRLFPVNMVQGRKENEGYRFLAEIDLSVQGQAANEACRALVIGARSLGIEFDVTFAWRSKEGAAFPGERGRLSLTAGSEVGKRAFTLDDF